MKPVLRRRLGLVIGLAACAGLSAPTLAGSRQQPAYAASPQVATAGTFISFEGGLDCLYDGGGSIASGEKPNDPDPNPEIPTASLRRDNCGWTGRAGFGQDRVNLFGGLFDSWAVFGRQSEQTATRFKATGATLIDTTLLTPNFQNSFEGRSQSRRTVIDVEAGKNLGIGTGIRVFMGLRYAHFEEKATVAGALTADGDFNTGFSAVVKNGFDGVGPRIGFASRARFATGGFGVMISGSAAALYGDQDSTIKATHGDPGYDTASKATKSGWVTNFEGEAALTLKTSIPGEFALGARIEAWYGETRSSSGGRSCVANALAEGCTTYTKGDSLSWGPFARWKIYLD